VLCGDVVFCFLSVFEFTYERKVVFVGFSFEESGPFEAFHPERKQRRRGWKRKTNSLDLAARHQVSIFPKMVPRTKFLRLPCASFRDIQL